MEAAQNGSMPPKVDDEQAKRLRRAQLKALNETQAGQGALKSNLCHGWQAHTSGRVSQHWPKHSTLLSSGILR